MLEMNVCVGFNRDYINYLNTMVSEIEAEHFPVFAGAGVSIDSGFVDWKDLSLSVGVLCAGVPRLCLEIGGMGCKRWEFVLRSVCFRKVAWEDATFRFFAVICGEAYGNGACAGQTAGVETACKPCDRVSWMV